MEPPLPIAISRQTVRIEERDAWKRLGLIVLATDLTSERDYARLMPRDTSGVYTTRVAFENPTTPDNLRMMGPLLTAAAALLLPGESLDAICYSCTAASVVIGDDAVRQAIQLSCPGVPVVTPSGAALMAFRALHVNRIAILTPYLIETSEPMVAYFISNGLEITGFECFGLADDRVMARVHRMDIVEAACRLDNSGTEAIFISCTALPSIAAIEEIESRIGKPVVTSNQASAWAMMRHAGLADQLPGYGQLFAHDLPGGAL